ncbi:basic blue protein-like [Ipomoea triloba]|uniref:basic blue protein-like n=1 Tax=Ipomoea triloba TaxID=35885 RepID=UPI00125CE0B3|nr:basic blue protein-like [Ipomoea triloba]
MVTQVIKLLNSFIPLSLSSRIFLICLVLLDAAKSETYTVGDGDEWSSGTNYVAWSEKHKFMADDVIVFKYVKGQHNVYEVTESTYESCDTSSGVLGKYESGNDQVKLKEARKYWFVCDKDGHCLGGMRFGINVMKSGGQTTNSSSNPTPPNTNHHHTTSASSKMWAHSILCSLLPLGIFFINILNY